MPLEPLFGNGAIAILVLAILAIEAVVLSPLLMRRGLGARYPQLLAGLMAGAGLVAALGAALADWSFHWVALLLGLSFLCHLVELALVLRKPRGP